jgi:ArsR family transcriptional regulator
MMTSIASLTTAFKALGDPTRLRILRILSGSELRVSEIVDILEMGQSRISRHLKILVDAGMLTARRSGVWTFYSIDPSSPYAETVSRAVASAAGDEEDLRRRGEILSKRRDETKEFFDSRAGRWESMKRHIFGGLDLEALVLECVPSGSSSIADLGCGEGRLVELASKRAGLVIGVDNAPAMVEYARSLHSATRGVEFRLGDIEHLPLKDDEVEAAIMSLVLHHLAQPAEAITEAARVIASDGVIVTAEFTPHDSEALRGAHGDRWLGIDPVLIEEWLEAAGCHIETRRMHELSDGIELCCITARKSHPHP